MNECKYLQNTIFSYDQRYKNLIFFFLLLQYRNLFILYRNSLVIFHIIKTIMLSILNSSPLNPSHFIKGIFNLQSKRNIFSFTYIHFLLGTHN